MSGQAESPGRMLFCRAELRNEKGVSGSYRSYGEGEEVEESK
jgi:hypothetical protein